MCFSRLCVVRNANVIIRTWFLLSFYLFFTMLGLQLWDCDNFSLRVFLACFERRVLNVKVIANAIIGLILTCSSVTSIVAPGLRM